MDLSTLHYVFAWANSVELDETPQNAASHQGLHCLPLIQQILDTTSGSKLYLFKLKEWHRVVVSQYLG